LIVVNFLLGIGEILLVCQVHFVDGITKRFHFYLIIFFSSKKKKRRRRRRRRRRRKKKKKKKRKKKKKKEEEEEEKRIPPQLLFWQPLHDFLLEYKFVPLLQFSLRDFLLILHELIFQ